jgi:hypothetical protein
MNRSWPSRGQKIQPNDKSLPIRDLVRSDREGATGQRLFLATPSPDIERAIWIASANLLWC